MPYAQLGPMLAPGWVAGYWSPGDSSDTELFTHLGRIYASGSIYWSPPNPYDKPTNICEAGGITAAFRPAAATALDLILDLMESDSAYGSTVVHTTVHPDGSWTIDSVTNAGTDIGLDIIAGDVDAYIPLNGQASWNAGADPEENVEPWTPTSDWTDPADVRAWHHGSAAHAAGSATKAPDAGDWIANGPGHLIPAAARPLYPQIVVVRDTTADEKHPTLLGPDGSWSVLPNDEPGEKAPTYLHTYNGVDGAYIGEEAPTEVTLQSGVDEVEEPLPHPTTRPDHYFVARHVVWAAADFPTAQPGPTPTAAATQLRERVTGVFKTPTGLAGVYAAYQDGDHYLAWIQGEAGGHPLYQLMVARRPNDQETLGFGVPGFELGWEIMHLADTSDGLGGDQRVTLIIDVTYDPATGETTVTGQARTPDGHFATHTEVIPLSPYEDTLGPVFPASGGRVGRLGDAEPAYMRLDVWNTYRERWPGGHAIDLASTWRIGDETLGDMTVGPGRSGAQPVKDIVGSHGPAFA